MSSFLEAMLSDPSGGHKELQDPTVSLPAILIEVGVGLYAGDAVSAILNFSTRRINKHLRGVRRFARGKLSDLKKFTTLRYTPLSASSDAQREYFMSQRRRYYRLREAYASRVAYIKSQRDILRKFPVASMARAARGIAITSLFAWGLSMTAEFASPGVRRTERKKEEQEPLQDQVFIDTRAAYTQRQRALQAIHDSQLSVSRAILGQEARYVHR